PTLVSLGSSSTMLTPAMTASSVSPPPLTISMALAQQFTPPLLRLALEMTTAPGRACAAAFRTIGSAAAPRIAARLVNVMPSIMSHGGYAGKGRAGHACRGKVESSGPGKVESSALLRLAEYGDRFGHNQMWGGSPDPRRAPGSAVGPGGPTRARAPAPPSDCHCITRASVSGILGKVARPPSRIPTPCSGRSLF